MWHRPAYMGVHMSIVMDAPGDTALMTIDDLSRELRIGARTLWRMISIGQFPPADLRCGRKIVRWRRATVQRWIAAGGGR
jgi:predicted DNA-binding transcriptional regulator AlpA